MRRVIAVDLMSLDGVMESPEGWAIEREVEDLKAVIDEASGSAFPERNPKGYSAGSNGRIRRGAATACQTKTTCLCTSRAT